MPNLPTKSLSQEHYDRVVASFPGATAAEKATAYDNWLTNRLIERVQMVETSKLEAQATTLKDAAFAALMATLPDKAPEPGMP